MWHFIFEQITEFINFCFCILSFVFVKGMWVGVCRLICAQITALGLPKGQKKHALVNDHRRLQRWYLTNPSCTDGGQPLINQKDIIEILSILCIIVTGKSVHNQQHFKIIHLFSLQLSFTKSTRFSWVIFIQTSDRTLKRLKT